MTSMSRKSLPEKSRDDVRHLLLSSTAQRQQKIGIRVLPTAQLFASGAVFRCDRRLTTDAITSPAMELRVGFPNSQDRRRKRRETQDPANRIYRAHNDMRRALPGKPTAVTECGKIHSATGNRMPDSSPLG